MLKAIPPRADTRADSRRGLTAIILRPGSRAAPKGAAFVGVHDRDYAPIVKRLNTELLKALHAPDIRAKLEAAGMPVIGTSAEEFATVVKDDIEMYRKIATGAGIKPE